MKKVKIILCVLMSLLTCLSNLGAIYASNTTSSSTPAGLTVKIGNLSGNVGDTVAVPITFQNLKTRMNNCDFKLSYDSTAAELISIDAGSIVTNPSVNFSSSINSNSGKAVLLFCDEIAGNAPITEDGVFANLTFKIKSLSNLKVFLKDIGAFNDPELNDIDVTFIDDTGIITPIPTPTPVIPTPTSRVSPTPTPTISPVPTPTPTPKVSPTLTITIGNVSGNIGDTVTVPVTFHNLKGNLNNCDFALSYDSNAVELTSVEAGGIVTSPSVNFTSYITPGKVAILFVDESQSIQPITKDGVFANLVFKIKSGISKISLAKIGSFNTTDLKDIAVTFANDTDINTPTPTPAASKKLSVQIGTVFGNVGHIVTVPIEFQQLNSKLNNCDFVLSYDSKVAELIAVNPGSIVTNPEVNFDSYITPGKVAFLFEDSTEGSAPITKNGVFANLVFQINPGISNISNISLAKLGAFNDTDLNEISVTYNTGVIGLATPEPLPTPTSIPTYFTAEIGTVYGNIGDTVTVPVTFKNLKSKLNNCDFTLLFDNNAVELTSVDAGSIVTNPSVNFTSSIGNGKAVLLFVDESAGNQPITNGGVFANLNFRIKSGSSKITLERLGSFNDPDLKDIAVTFTSGIINHVIPPTTPEPEFYTTNTVTIGNVSGKAEDTIKVPITFHNFEAINNCDFTLSYDSNAVELRSVDAGSIVTNPSVNFTSAINNGKVVLMFIDETQGNQPITKDGIFAYLNFKIKSGITSKISLLDVGSFNDSDLNDIYTTFRDGGIFIALSTPVPSLSPTPTPTPTPTSTPVPSITPTPTPTMIPTYFPYPSMIKVDAGNLKDISVNIGNIKFGNITNGNSCLTENDYTITDSGNPKMGRIITISKWYLNYYFSKFPDQNLYLKFSLSSGPFVLTVYKGSTPFVSMTDSTSYPVNSGDLQLSLILNGNFITGIKNGDKTLASRIDYTYDPSAQIFYIRKGYLNSYFSQTSQPLKLTVNFTGDSKTIVIYPIPEN